MGAELKEILTAANEKTQYDTYAKRLLSEKCILACILTEVVDEFKGMKPKEAERYIEGETFVGSVPTEPGLTNAMKETGDLTTTEPGNWTNAEREKTATGSLTNTERESLEMFSLTDAKQDRSGQRIVGLNTIHAEIMEGVAVFDIVLYARLPEVYTRIIVNLEAQKDEPTGYDILNRAVFYMARLISSQKERDFTKVYYNDMKRVYSIWICMNMKECSWNHMHLTDEAILGQHCWKGERELINFIFLGIPKKLPGTDERYRLHRLLGALFSLGLSVEERISILENEYEIQMNDELEGRLGKMCNLGQGIWEQGVERGEELGRAEEKRATAQRLQADGFEVSIIARIVDASMELICEWLGLAPVTA
ncbi:MAG: Rpn family recombination-promoting nuclease/putative transposase [Lachnospiraceae bacterium]|nr:Rpn family recombination-promoting nuclease/putative transposase [Lachnospiraceae bacterium]